MAAHISAANGYKKIFSREYNQWVYVDAVTGEIIDISFIGGGTPDPTFDPETDITYVGAFNIPYNAFSNSSSGTLANAISMAYKPADGTNGSRGSLFLGGFKTIAEVSIPDYTGTSEITDADSLPSATVLQDWVDVYSQHSNIDSSFNGSASSAYIGAMEYVDGDLHMSWYPYYSDSSTKNYSVCYGPEDLSTATFTIQMSADYGDHAARYWCEIPSDLQAGFDGHTHLGGVFFELSIVGRSSHGASVITWDASGVGSTDTNVTSTQRSHYDASTIMSGCAAKNADVVAFYESYTDGYSLTEYCDIDPGVYANRYTSFDDFPAQADDSIRIKAGNYMTKCGCAFIPEGSNSLILIGHQSGIRYGFGYKNKFLNTTYDSSFYGSDLGNASGWRNFDTDDHDNCIWQINLDDVKNPTNSSDPEFIKMSMFDNNRWLTTSGGTKSGAILSGKYDSSSGLLFLLHDRMPYAASNYVSQKIVSVYQVGGAA